MQGKSSLLPAEPAATITVATNDDCLTYTVAQAARLAGVSVSYYWARLLGLDQPSKLEMRRSVEEVDALDREIEQHLAQRDGRDGGGS